MAADAHRGIDVAAPLLSVRRHGGGGTGKLLCREPDDDAMPGSGVAPYRWEHRPAGHPKSVRTRRARPPLPAAHDEAAALVAASVPVPEAARFSDALSRVDSCFTVDCSAAGLSDAGAPTGHPGARGGSVMMDRFLWAAKAVAVGLPQHQQTFRKAAAAAVTGASAQETARPAPANARISDGDSLLPRRLNVELERSPANHVPSSYTKEDKNDNDDGGEWDAHSTAGFASRRCGLLPTRCVNVKTTLQLLLLNPAQAMKRSRGAARRFLPGRGEGGQGDTNPLLRRKEDHLEHDATTQQTWEELYINSLLLRSDRRRCMKLQTTMASELDRTVRALYTNTGDGVHPKATHLGLLLVLDRRDDSENASLLPAKCSGPAKVKTVGGRKLRPDGKHGFPPLLEEKTTASHDIVPWTEPALTLPKPKSPSESWLSRALPSVSNKPPATSFLGIHVKQAPSPWCSSEQARVDDHARPRQIRIQDLQK